MATTYEELETRVAALERLAQELKLEALVKVFAGSGSRKSTRRKREYTEEERAAIRARLLAGQEAARKRRENEHKVKPSVVKTAKDIKKVVSPVTGNSMKGDTVE